MAFRWPRRKFIRPIPIGIGYDQPGIAARIAHHGVGEFVEVEDLTIEGLSRADVAHVNAK
jgi:hypothetical protein